MRRSKRTPMERLASGLYVPPYLKMGWWPCEGCGEEALCASCSDETLPDEFTVTLGGITTGWGGACDTWLLSLNTSFSTENVGSGNCLYGYVPDTVVCTRGAYNVTLNGLWLYLSYGDVIRVMLQWYIYTDGLVETLWGQDIATPPVCGDFNAYNLPLVSNDDSVCDSATCTVTAV